jgi:FkbM family methyltransferase
MSRQGKYYSGDGVDREIEPLLPEVGFACEVGANDGQFLSNTLYFEEKGWTVLCVEPNPELVKYGHARRKLWRQVAAGSEDAEDREFRFFGIHPYASNSSLCRPGVVEDVQFRSAMVVVRRLDRILEEAGFHRLDFLAVDVEGWEQEVMSGFTIERWRPKVIVLESWTDDQPAPPGYTRTARRQYDNIYLRNE